MGDDQLSRPGLGGVSRGFWAICIGVFLIGFGARMVLDAVTSSSGPDRLTAAAVLVDQLRRSEPPARTTSVYGGLGVWVVADDLSPRDSGTAPLVTPAAVEDWAALGVRTVYLQAARSDGLRSEPLLEPGLLAELLLRSHAAGLHVVGWYLPTFADVDADLERLLGIAEFDALGHRFDGIAVDIEHVEAVPDVEERSARLIALSEALRDGRPGEALGAIVPPAVQLEVVDPTLWPRFPWRALATSYDVWLPMAHWTTRAGTPYADAYAYTEESTRRMRANIGRADVVVHPVGGIGDRTTPEDLEGFRQALLDTGAIGGSLYDWAGTTPELRSRLATLVPE